MFVAMQGIGPPKVVRQLGTDGVGNRYTAGYAGMICRLDFTVTRFGESKPE